MEVKVTLDVNTTPLKHCSLMKISGRIDSYTSPQLEKAMEDCFSARRFKIV